MMCRYHSIGRCYKMSSVCAIPRNLDVSLKIHKMGEQDLERNFCKPIEQYFSTVVHIKIIWGIFKNTNAKPHLKACKLESLGMGHIQKFSFLIFPGDPNVQSDWEPIYTEQWPSNLDTYWNQLRNFSNTDIRS